MPITSESSEISVEKLAEMGENKEVGAQAVGAASAPEQSAVGGREDMPTSKRTTAPAFQFYPKDFLTSPKVMQMTATERGIYITLLSVCWLEGGLPDDIKQLASLARVPAKQLARLWPHQLQACFTLVRNGRLVNDRLEHERKKQAAFRDRQSENGKKGGRRLGLAKPNPPLSTRNMESEDRKDGSSILQEKEERLDLAFIAFRDAYPGNRRKGGRLIEEAFMHAAHKAGGSARLMAALANHNASEQWSNPRLIPGMELWFEDERWRQVLPAAGAVTSSANNPKTAGNVGAFQRFIDRGKAS